MKFEPTAIDGVWRIELSPIRDERGFFARAWSRDEFAERGMDAPLVQANLARNPVAGTLRGIHFQRAPHAEAKFVRCLRGSLFDVAVDLREDSPTYLRWVGVTLTAEGGESLWLPPGTAHGYLTLEPDTDLLYHTSERYAPDAAGGLRYDDPRLAIDWPRDVALVSEADRAWPLLDAEPATA